MRGNGATAKKQNTGLPAQLGAGRSQVLICPGSIFLAIVQGKCRLKSNISYLYKLANEFYTTMENPQITACI
jgi:hypothetical protein